MTTGKEKLSGWLVEDWLDSNLACELLKQGQYEQLAELLHQLQVTIAQTDAPLLVDILAAAGQICSACGQSRAELAWHEQATQKAHQREQELRQELFDILGLISKQGVYEIEKKKLAVPAASLTEAGLPESSLAKPSDLFYRIWNWLRGNGMRRLSGQLKSFSSGIMLTPLLSREGGGRSSPSLVIYCFGPFRGYQDDQPIEEWTSGKGKSIFKYLVTHREYPIAKEILMDIFWPEANPDAARNNLNVAIYGLRRDLRKVRPTLSHILFHDGCYLLNPELQIWIDVEAFKEHFRTALILEQQGKVALAIREYHAAEALYQGEFLAEDRYEEWLLPQRRSLQTDYLNLLDCLSRYYLDQGDYDVCATICSKMLVVDTCREEAHRRLMRCYSQQGQPYLALRQYHQCVERLKKELDVPPTPQTITLYEQIQKGKRK